ncbi:exo-beta-N-acetylmuramidase NamZ family protein [Winogradskyella poriferorum]|uniref:exo-beta-N-acetylmuramidase NamZ family protein n=1 Tax=Winogradskyella poriferorum TaxID=307627 RepID=UPI003D64C72B
MRFRVIKNTLLLFVLIVISCASKTKEDTSTIVKVDNRVNEDKTIIVGANQTEKYIPLLKGKRVGIVANQTSLINKRLPKVTAPEIKENTTYHLVDYLNNDKSITVKKVFSPEHGFRGAADAGEDVKDGVDTKTQLPILSLHGKNKKPTNEQLSDLDIMVFDIQDVGVRFYTYISTLHYVMEACAENNLPLIILDRPNPNGNYFDGPTLEIEHRSFLGMHPIPLVHGMTIGEYAQMINGEGWLKEGITCDIEIIKMVNYTHESTYSLPKRPSPNLPNDQAIKLYPSLGLFEGTNINAGRGTEYQFQRYGAPFLDKEYYSFSYTPIPNFGSKYPKHQDKVCFGADLSQINVERSFTLKYIIDAYNNATDKSMFFNTSNFTTHAGTKKLQQQIESGWSEEDIKLSWQKELKAFKKTRSKYLIYD